MKRFAVLVMATLASFSLTFATPAFASSGDSTSLTSAHADAAAAPAMLGITSPKTLLTSQDSDHGIAGAGVHASGFQHNLTGTASGAAKSA